MNSLCLVVIQTHNLVVVTLCASLCVVHSTIPQTDGTFYVVRWVVVTHDEYEHLFALFFAEAVVERITLLDASLFKYAVAVFYQYRGNLHSTTTLAAYGSTVSFTLHLDDSIHKWFPIKFCPVVTGVCFKEEAVNHQCNKYYFRNLVKTHNVNISEA